MSRLRTSASVLLTRGPEEAPEILLVERSPALRFFGGYWSFPGGVVDEVDREESDGDHEAALERCALRELFEETGVLAPPLGDGLEAGQRAALRDDLLARPPRLAQWRARRAQLERARGALRVFCRITTPPFAPVRYRNLFLQAALPAGEEVRVLPGELVRGRFWRPAEVLTRWRAGELAVVPPALYLLQILARAPLPQAIAEAQRLAGELEAGRLHAVYFTPGVMMAPLQTPTLPPATTTNAYLVGEERVYVVDPATYADEERARLFDTLDRWRGEGRELAGVLLTHHHTDHVGSAHATAARYGLPVLAHAETLRRLTPPPEHARELGDGEALELGTAPDGTPGWRLHALHTPGHAPGHLVFLEDRYRACLAGDMVATLSTVVIDPEDGHLATYLASLQRLLEVGVGVLYPAHGPAERDGPALLRRYLAHRSEREERLVQALAAGLEYVAELVPRVYSDTPEELHPLAARSLLAGLIKLEEEGRARRAGGRWRLVDPAPPADSDAAPATPPRATP